MKKLFSVLVLVLSAAVFVNAQTTTKTTKTTTTTQKSSPVTVKVADLPKTITDNIAKDYPDFAIKQATSVSANNVKTYHVVVMKGSTTNTLVYDNDGKFLKKLAAKTGKKK